MTAASNSDARKRNAAQVDPVEVVARTEFDLTGPWCDLTGIEITWDDLRTREPDSYRIRRINAGRIIAALRENGFAL